MSDTQYIDEISSQHPEALERLRAEILENVTHRADEAQKAFTGLMTFCGVVYTGSTVGLLSYLAGRAQGGAPYCSIVAFVSFAVALLAFAILYQCHSQLMAKRYAYYADVAHRFFGFSDLSVETCLSI